VLTFRAVAADVVVAKRHELVAWFVKVAFPIDQQAGAVARDLVVVEANGRAVLPVSIPVSLSVIEVIETLRVVGMSVSASTWVPVSPLMKLQKRTVAIMPCFSGEEQPGSVGGLRHRRVLDDEPCMSETAMPPPAKFEMLVFLMRTLPAWVIKIPAPWGAVIAIARECRARLRARAGGPVLAGVRDPGALREGALGRGRGSRQRQRGERPAQPDGRYDKSTIAALHLYRLLPPHES